MNTVVPIDCLKLYDPRKKSDINTRFKKMSEEKLMLNWYAKNFWYFKIARLEWGRTLFFKVPGYYLHMGIWASYTPQISHETNDTTYYIWMDGLSGDGNTIWRPEKPS